MGVAPVAPAEIAVYLAPLVHLALCMSGFSCVPGRDPISCSLCSIASVSSVPTAVLYARHPCLFLLGQLPPVPTFAAPCLQ